VQRARQAAGDSAKQLFKDWAALTFVTDHQRLIGPITPTILNWTFLTALIAAAYFTTGHTSSLAIAAGAWLFLTAARANHIQRQRRKQIGTIFDTVAPRAKLSAGTAANPTNPAHHIQRIRWGAGSRPTRFTLPINSAARAATAPLLRSEVEADIENIPHALTKSGGEWLFEWNKNRVTATAAPADDPRVAQKAQTRRITALVRQIFGVRDNALQGWTIDIGRWEPTADSDEHPTIIAVRCSDQDLTDLAYRDTVERHFERAIPTPGEWLFTWDASASTMKAESIDPKSLEAQRKRIQRRLSDDMNSLVPRQGKDPIVVEVSEWIADDQALPRSLHVTFGTLALDDPRKIDHLEDGFDQAVNNRWPTARALFGWIHGATTELDITLVAHDDPEALQRAALTRFRNVTQSKFGNAKNPVTTEVLDWQESLSPNGTALPQKARVNFGTVDVTKPDTKDAFQDHWDSIDDNNDWHYQWNTPQGYVEMTAVPTLATAIPFPNSSDEQHDELVRHFRQGRIILGPKKGGGWFMWNLNKVPHGLIGGRTGSGKSVLLDNILYLILLNRDMSSIVVCDPKMTDFTWTREYPNVIRFAAGVEEICTAIDLVYAEMQRRQRLLNRRGVRNIGYLRDLYAEHPEYLAEDGGKVPERIFLLFDEIANFLGASSNKDLEELKDDARTKLESIGQLARAMEINMIVAAQKPEAKYVSTQLKQMMELRVCVGPVDEYTSRQILESTHGTRFGEGTPKGRAWASTSEQGHQVVQVPYLPSATEPAPWDPSITIEGSRERLAADLSAHGWHRILVPNADGGQDGRWTRIDDTPADGPSTSEDDPDSATIPQDLPDDAADVYLNDPVTNVRVPVEIPFDPMDEPPWDTD
jgi:hypothetical protein